MCWCLCLGIVVLLMSALGRGSVGAANTGSWGYFVKKNILVGKRKDLCCGAFLLQKVNLIVFVLEGGSFGLGDEFRYTILPDIPCTYHKY